MGFNCECLVGSCRNKKLYLNIHKKVGERDRKQSVVILKDGSVAIVAGIKEKVKRYTQYFESTGLFTMV